MPSVHTRRRNSPALAFSVSFLIALSGSSAGASERDAADGARPLSPAAAAREARIQAQLAATPDAVPMIADQLGGLPNYDVRFDLAGNPSAAAVASVAAIHAAPARKVRTDAAASLLASMPELRIDDDPIYATPRFVRSTAALLTPPAKAGPADIAAQYIHDHAALFEIDALEIPAARIARDYRTDHNGVTHLTFQQLLRGLDLFSCEVRANVTADGRLINIASTMLPRPRGDFEPTGFDLPEADLIIAAARHAGITLREVPQPAGPAGGPGNQTTWRTPAGIRADEPVVSRRIYFPVTREDIRAALSVVIAAPGIGHTYDIIVDAATGALLWRADRLMFDSTQPVTMRVYTSDGVAPMSPGLPAPTGGQAPLATRNLVVVNPADVIAFSPNGWINDGNTETVGNNVDAHADVNADNTPDTPRPSGGPSRVFDFPLDPLQEPGTYLNASITQLFYLTNLYHDRLYALGFNEAAGNFQTINFTGLGTGNDAVQADCQDGYGLATPNANNANFGTSGADGSSARMQMYVFTGPSPDRDGSLEVDIVYHELTHGTSVRLHGGLSALQSRGMGEGWSDYFGHSLLAEPGDDPNGTFATGGYTTFELWGPAYNNNYYFGIRRYPYSTNLLVNPLTLKFADLAQLVYPDGSVPRNTNVIDRTGTTTVSPTVHSLGELWCNTLLEARALLWARDGFSGNQLMMQLVVDGMKLSVGNPTYLQARDAILQADLVNNAGANRFQLWSAFAKRGMGFSAASPASSTTTGLVEAFDLPFAPTFTYPDGRPSLLTPGAPTAFRVVITPPAEFALTPGTAAIAYSINGSSPVIATLAATGSPNEFTATIPAVACLSNVAWSIRVGTAIGNKTDPATGSYTTLAATGVTVTRSDDFETDTGWTVGPNTATSGVWVRANPVGTIAQPEDDNSTSGTICWVTGNGAVGGADGAADVDGGFTTLTSPTLDLTGGADARVSYARWYSNGEGGAPHADTFRVDVSTNNGSTWTNVETIGPGSTSDPDTNPGWRAASWTLSQKGITPTSTMRIRFIAEDLATGSLVEAALDDFAVEILDCSVVPPPCPADFNNSGGPPTVQDIFDFLAAYFAGVPAADFNDSGSVTVQDIFDFLAAYFTGCP